MSSAALTYWLSGAAPADPMWIDERSYHASTAGSVSRTG
jgi:hypothetical protein